MPGPGPRGHNPRQNRSPSPCAARAKPTYCRPSPSISALYRAGVSPNLVPSSARAALDIRLPVGRHGGGRSCQRCDKRLDLPGIAWRVLRCFEPNYTDPADELVARCAARADVIGNGAARCNMRVGGSGFALVSDGGHPDGGLRADALQYGRARRICGYLRAGRSSRACTR